jgi:RHS repeat-associated protein
MKSITLLATLLLTALAPVWAVDPAPVSGSAIFNPTPSACCECFALSIEGLEPNGSPKKAPDGSFKVNVRVFRTATSSANCPTDKELKITLGARVLKNSIPVGNTTDIKEVTIGSGVMEKIVEFTLLPDVSKLGDEWQFTSVCGGNNDDSQSLAPNEQDKVGIPGCTTKTIPLRGCSSCTSGCSAAGTPSAGNATFNMNSISESQEGFMVSIPTTDAMGGDSSGSLTFFTQTFANPGRAALLANLPSDFATTKDGQGLITSLNTGSNIMQIGAADAALLSLDPKAFVITHKDPGGNIFRTTTISCVTEAGTQRLRMDTSFDGSITRIEQTRPQPGTLVLEEGKVVSNAFEALSRETVVITTPISGKRVHHRTVETRASTASAWSTTSDVETTWENQIRGWMKTKEVVDPNGISLTSTWSYYQPGELTGPSGANEGLGKVKQYTSYNGSTTFHTYELHQTTVTTPYAGNPAGKIHTSTWDPSSQTFTTTTTINGTLVSKSSESHTDTSVTRKDYTSANGILTSVTHFSSSGQDFGGRPIRTLHSDGTLTTYSYTRNAGGGHTTVTEKGSTSNGTTVSQGMRSITTTNSRGTTILSKTEAIGYGAANGQIYNLIAVTSVDDLGRALTTAYHPTSATVTGEVASASSPAWITSVVYSCCGVSSETDMYGVTTYYAYDHLQRQIKSNRLGVTTETHHNGLITETHRYAETVSASLSPALQGTSATLVSKSVSNLTGTLQESWSPDPTSVTSGALIKSSSTAISYLNPQGPNIPLNLGSGIGQRSVTTTVDNFSQTTDSFLDGRAAATYGLLSFAMQYAYTVNATGKVTSQSYVDGTNLRETTTTQSDWAGRTVRMDYMDGAFATMEYNSLGQMVKSTDPDGVVSLMLYNAEGEQVISAVDLNANGIIDYGVDNVTSSESDPALDNASNPVWKSISKVWQPGDTSPTGGTIVSTTLQSINGLASASQSIGVANPSTQLTVLSGNGNWTTTSTASDGTKQVQEYIDGRMVSMASLATNNSVIESQTQGYDALDRPVTSTHSRTGVSTTTYLSNTADIVASVSDAGGRITALTYDVRGRQVSINAPDTLDTDGNTLTNVMTTTYNPDSTIAETDGNQTYRVSHTYDYADRKISMTTYGAEIATTTWQYSTTRGFLLAKRDASNKGANYTYNAAGRLATRTWARGVTITYTYDNGGRMVSANYSDTTPDITMAYDAMGRQTTQSNGVATSTFSYNSSNLQVDTETVAYDLNADNTIDFTRVIDRTQDSLNRDAGWQLKAGTTIENEVAYSYGSTDGRLASVNRGASSFSYGYTPNSSLIANVTSPVHTVSNVYETNRNVLASKVNKVDTTTISGYFYTVNNFDQRTGVEKDGTAFSTTRTIAWGYNSKGEVVKADSSESGLDRAYQYDGIGNRLKSANGLTLPSTNNYTPNILNQYVAIDAITPSHDDDGNATAYPLPANTSANSALVWDGENRLIQAQVNGGATVSYVYDSQSRRIAESVGTTTTVYVYDGWNPITEYSSTFALTKTYTWGSDLSGSMQGAGGVGGLLAVSDGTGIYYPTFDGNGNVSEYLNATGAIAAHYEYDPFGKTTVINGSKANDFVHRFSTKPLDLITELYYYGYRFYDPQTGRWPSRDPIEESGGYNLYGFVANDGVNAWDILGLAKKCCIESNPRYKLDGGKVAVDGDQATRIEINGRQEFGFTFDAKFKHDESIDCCSDCCEVRQYIKWDQLFHQSVGGPPHAGYEKDSAAGVWHEDRNVNDKRYGHRNDKHTLAIEGVDEYMNDDSERDMLKGKNYYGSDAPSGPIGITGVWEFKLEVIDVCNEAEKNKVMATSPVIKLTLK